MELIVRHREREEKVNLERRNDGTYCVKVGDQTYEIDVASARARTIFSLNVKDGRQFEVAVRRLKNHGHAIYQISSKRGHDTVEVMDPLTYLAEQSRAQTGGGSQQVRAYMPGRVVEILAHEGAEVESGQGVVVLEAMKMKNEIPAERAGKVIRVFVKEGQTVEGGDPLFEVG
jgi:biotin carboxyl carrier protein